MIGQGHQQGKSLGVAVPSLGDDAAAADILLLLMAMMTMTMTTVINNKRWRDKAGSGKLKGRKRGRWLYIFLGQQKQAPEALLSYSLLSYSIIITAWVIIMMGTCLFLQAEKHKPS